MGDKDFYDSITRSSRLKVIFLETKYFIDFQALMLQQVQDFKHLILSAVSEYRLSNINFTNTDNT